MSIAISVFELKHGDYINYNNYFLYRKLWVGGRLLVEMSANLLLYQVSKA